MKSRTYFPAFFLIATVLIYISSVFANVDMGFEQQNCSKEKDFLQNVTNGKCYWVIIGRGIENVLRRWDGQTVMHRYPQGCGDIEWHEENPEWKQKICAPTFSCLNSPNADITYASFISDQEQPYQNAPEVNPPIFPLDKDYIKTIVFSDNASVADTSDLCQYTCNDGYKLSTSACTNTGSTTDTCTVAPTITIAAPIGVVSGTNAVLELATNAGNITGVIVTTQGSGYSIIPKVAINIPNGGTCAPYTPNIKTTLTGGKVTNAILQVLSPTVEVSRWILEPNKLYFAVIQGGAGYTTSPTVTIGGLSGAGCVGLTSVAHINNRGSLETVWPNNGFNGFDIPSICTGTPTVTVSAPPALSTSITCPANTLLIVAEPTNTVTGTTAIGTVFLNGTTLTATVTDGWLGYSSNPSVTVSGGTCIQMPSATAIIDPATKKVTAVTFGFSGSPAYAISHVFGSMAVIPTNGGGSGYTTAPLVSVTGGVCTTRPLAISSISSAGVVTGVTLIGAAGCTVAPILTIASPSAFSCTGTGNVDKCIPLVCTGIAPTTAQYCVNDTAIAGHENQPNVRRSDTSQCTSNAKCEWFCPVATPFYCESANTCVTSQNQCGQTNTCKTSAPSELKTETDFPLIQCDAISVTGSHFRYKITKTGGTATDTYISPLFTVWTSVKHPTTFYAGTYTVTCLYGTIANTNNTLTDYGMTPDASCNKTMTVNDTSNGCSRLYPYRGATLSDSLTSNSAFDASFRCGSRQSAASTTDTKSYRLQIGTGIPAFLAYDRIISDIFITLAIGPVSTQTQNYNFSSGTDVSCAVKVGEGYSTNTSCQARACVGSTCATPQTFIVVPSEEITCTNKDSISYDVWCNAASPDYTQCLKWIYEGTSATRNVKVKINGVEVDRYFTCSTSTPPGALGPVKECTIVLPTGGAPVTIFAGDARTDAQGNITSNYSFQTTAYTLAKDTGKPTGSIAYYSNYSNGTILSQDQYEYWQKQPITAVITCTDKTSANESWEKDGPSCACSNTLTSNNTWNTPTPTEQSEIDQWSRGIPSTNINIWSDIMTYSRVIANNSASLTGLNVKDVADNISIESFSPDFGIDSTPPRLIASKTTNSVTLSFTDNHVGASGIWKFSDNVPVATPSSPQIFKGWANNAILYRTWLKSQLANLEFGPDCSPLPVKNTNYYKYKEVPAAPLTQTLTLNSFDVNNNVVAYCVQDNAGNINRGYYPNNLTGCFSASPMSTIPTLSPSTLTSHYAPILRARLLSSTLSDSQKYGYSLSENSTNANCFRGILASNVTTLVANQLIPRTNTTLSDWNTDRALIKGTPPIPNTNWYYYYSYSSPTNNTLSITTSPTGTGSKSVIVDWGNIQINENIEYLGTGKTLILIARKNAAGNGGNIYIKSSVTRIDAIIIADGGAIMNGTTTSGTTTTKNWITNASDLSNRLTINGRLYSYNTRWGSITPQVSPGTDFDPITGNTGKYFNTSVINTPLISTTSPTQAAIYDLERFRVMLSDGNSQCTTHVNYQTFTTNGLPALLVRPIWFIGGNCWF